MKLKTWIIGAGLICAAQFAHAQWRILNVPLVTQQHSEWCWAGSSQAILNYYGESPSQCQIVNWAYGINYACGSSYFDWNSYANAPNSLFGGGGSVQDILWNYGGISNYAYNYAISWNSVVNDINNNRPFVIRYGWTNGGGHIMVGRGYETWNGTNYIYIMNPWPGEGQTYDTYDDAVSSYDHNWTHTLRVTR